MPAALGKMRLSILLVAASIGVSAAVEYLAPSVASSVLTTMYRLRGVEKPPPGVMIVGIDDASINEIGPWPWRRGVVAQLIDNVAREHPKAIALDVVFAERKDPAEDLALGEAIRRAGNVVLAAQLIEGRTQESSGPAETGRDAGQLSQWLMPVPEIAAGARAIGHVHAAPDVDGELNSVQLSKSSSDAVRRWALALELLRLSENIDAAPEELSSSLKVGSFVIPILDRSAAQAISPASLHRANEMRINYAGPAATFPTISAADILNGKAVSHRLEGTVVLIGATSQSLGDTGQTPFSHFGGLRASGLKMPGVEVHANIYTTIRERKWFRPIEGLPAVALTIFVLIAGAFVTLRLSGVMQLLGPALLILAVPAAGLVLFSKFSIILPAGSMLAGLLVLVPGLSLGRSLLASRDLDRQLARLEQTQRELLPVSTSFARLPGEGRATLLPQTLDWKLQTVAGVTDHLLNQIAAIDRMLRSVGNGVLLADSEHRIIFANPAASELVQRPSEEIIGADIDNLFAGRSPEGKTQALISGETRSFEIQVSSAPARYLEVSIFPLGSPGERAEREGAVVVLADITKRRQLDQTKSEMLRLVSHELRTPVSAIQGLSEVLTKFGLPPGEVQEFGRTIHAESGRLLELVNRYLDLTRLESDQQKLQLADIDFAELAQETVESHRMAAAQKHMQIVFQGSPPMTSVRADASLLKIAIGNLLANAIKYGPAGSEVFVRIHVRNGSVELSVRDKGPGIPAAEQERIFEKFYRLRREDHSETPGTGLGLAMVREIVTRHGGKVRVDSNEAQGATFRITIPLAF